MARRFQQYPARREDFNDEQLRALAHELRTLFKTRGLILGEISDEVLLDRYFEGKRREQERPHKKVVKPVAPWHEMQRIQVLVERVAANAYAAGSTAASSGILNHPFTLDAPH